MKHLFSTSLLIALTVFSFGQLPYVGPGQPFVFPNVTNHFIDSGSISWALDTEEAYSFADSKKVENEDIFVHLISKTISGKLEAYYLMLTGFEGYENNAYSAYDKYPNRYLTKNALKFALTDSLKTIKFHEIFYLDNFRLNCQIVSAAPMTNHAASSGVSLGMQNIFYCCKNIKETIQITKNKDLVHFKKIERILNIDSIENSKIVKQTYGLNLIQSIWSGASQGFIKLLDTKTNRVIPIKDVMNYSHLDSVQVQVFDSTGSVVEHIMKAGQAVFPYKLTNTIQFTQDFYYDTKQNVFISTISDCFLFIKNWDDVNSVLTVEKRFKVL